MNVLVEGNLIKEIATSKIVADNNAIIIDGGGRTLMPGLIDSHVHINMYKDGTLLYITNLVYTGKSEAVNLRGP